MALPHASLFLGIIPALILLYLSLKGYEGYYRDKTIFLTFVIGMGLGFFAALARIYSVPAVLLYIVLIAILEQLLKTVVLNLRRLQGKRETVIYGLSLGLGFGAIFTPFLMVAVGNSYNLSTLSLIIIGSLGLILFHSSTGAYIGYGVFMGELTKYLVGAIIIQLPFNGLVDMTRLFFLSNYFLYLQVAVLMYSGVFFVYVIKKIMPKILEQRRKRSRI